MPKKPNFLGGEQNYNKSTGEYEPNLVGPNGKVVTDADGDGVSHESKQEQDFNDPSERESLKVEEKDFNKSKEQEMKDNNLKDKQNAIDRLNRAFPKQIENSLPKYEEGKPGEDYDFYDDGTFTIKNKKTAHSSFEEPSVAYDNLGRFYGIDLEKVIYGKGGYEEERDKSDFNGDIIYSENEWNKFEDWLKQKHGVDLEQIRKDKFEEYKKSHTPRKRFDWWK